MSTTPCALALLACVVSCKDADTAGARPEAIKQPVQQLEQSTAGLSEAELGVPFYPNAVQEPQRAQRLDLGTYYQRTAMFSTSDPAAAVLAFYRAKLGPGAGDAGVHESTTDAKHSFFVPRGETAVTAIGIEPTSNAKGTNIVITASGPKQ